MTFGYHGPAFGADQMGVAGRLAALGLGLGHLPQELRQNRGLAVLNVFGGGEQRQGPAAASARSRPSAARCVLPASS